MKDLLIVVDMQNDFIYDALGSADAQAIVPKVVNKIKEFDADSVYFTRDTHQKNYMETQEGKNLPVPHCIQYTKGWEIIDDITSAYGLPEFDTNIVDKPTFGFTRWGNILLNNKINSITLIGVCTDICVISNALILKATFPETEIIVDSSCCAGLTPEKHAAALEVMKSCQITVI